MIKDEIVKNLKQSFEKIGIKEENLDLKRPSNPNFGDYATSIALKLAKKLKKNPVKIAEEIIKNFPKNDLLEKMEIVKPGFINFWLSKYNLLLSAKQISSKFSFNSFYLGNIKKVMVEFAHPNTHKLFHIGHLRNISTGESIVRIFEASGNKVIRANYQGDVGLHIAKCLWSLRNEIKKNGKDFFKTMTLREKIFLVGKHYTAGTKAYEENEKAKKEIIDVNRMIYELSPEIMDLWKKTRSWSLEYFNEIYKRVYSRFDRFFFESELPKRGVEIVNFALKKGILEKSQGAIVFNGKKHGLDTRVFVNSLGFPTYEGKELALAEKEFSEFGEIDKCIHVVTPEQASFFKVTFKVEEFLDEKKFKNKQYHLIYEWVKLKTGKMSSREGNVIEGDWLLDETKNKILKQFKCYEELAEILAVASVKYSFLKNATQNEIAFDFNESISLEGNSAPYLIYTYVRCQSVLKKTKKCNMTIKKSNNLTINPEELVLLRSFPEYLEVVYEAAKNFSPNLIANYLFDLAQKFNLFYQKYPILKADKETKKFRLLLTNAVGQVIKNGLYLLGIKTVEKM